MTTAQTTSSSSMSLLPYFTPRLVILLSGKRKSGKDFLTEKLRQRLSTSAGLRVENEEDEREEVKEKEERGEEEEEGEKNENGGRRRRRKGRRGWSVAVIRLSAPLKKRFAVENRLDFDKLLDASEYKETFRKGSFLKE